MNVLDPDTVAEDSLLEPIRVRGDRVMTIVCWVLWLTSLGFAVLFHEWYGWLIGGSILAMAASALTTFAPGQLGTRMGMGVIFMLFCALLIDQSHGMIESHFSIFALLSFLLYYRDTRPLLAATLVTAAHHAGFCWMQMAGYGVYIFPPGHPCTMVYVHVAYVFFETIVLVLLATAIRKEALEAAAFARLGAQLSDEGVIDLGDAGVQLGGDASRGVAARGLPQFLNVLQSAVTRAGKVACGMGKVSGEMTEAAVRMVKTGRAQQLSAGDVVATAGRMDAAVDEMSVQCNEVAQVVRGSSALVEEGRDAMREAVSHMETLAMAVGGVAQEIAQMQQESARIEEIIRIIEESADRTSLLALNAAIEAARAGEMGRGFAVVAQEVKSLSERTHGSLLEAKGVVEAVKVRTAQIGLTVDACRDEAALGGARVSVANRSLEKVIQQLPKVVDRAEHVMEGAVRQRNLTGEVTRQMQLIGSAVATNHSDLDRIDKLCGSLRMMAGDLVSSFSLFRSA